MTSTNSKFISDKLGSSIVFTWGINEVNELCLKVCVRDVCIGEIPLTYLYDMITELAWEVSVDDYTWPLRRRLNALKYIRQFPFIQPIENYKEFLALKAQHKRAYGFEEE